MTTSTVPQTVKPTSQPNILEKLRAISSSYVARKTFKALFTAWAVVTFTFFLIRLLPGNPIEVYVNQLVVQYSIPYHEARD